MKYLQTQHIFVLGKILLQFRGQQERIRSAFQGRLKCIKVLRFIEKVRLKDDADKCDPREIMHE